MRTAQHGNIRISNTRLLPMYLMSMKNKTISKSINYKYWHRALDLIPRARVIRYCRRHFERYIMFRFRI